jgi:hypothetical protein
MLSVSRSLIGLVNNALLLLEHYHTGTDVTWFNAILLVAWPLCHVSVSTLKHFLFHQGTRCQFKPHTCTVMSDLLTECLSPVPRYPRCMKHILLLKNSKIAHENDQ